MRASMETRRHFSVPPELARSAPRDVALTRGGRALIAVAVLLAAAAVFAGVALYLEAQRQLNAALDFDRRGVTTSATVDRLWRKNDDGKPAYAAFHFEANGARIAGERRMQLSAWRELSTGSTLPVRYLPDDPRVFVVAGARLGRMPLAIPYVVAGALAALALICLIPVRRQRALLSEGRAAAAVVTKVRKHQGSKGASYREIFYEFPVLAGTKVTGKAVATSPADVGGTIAVVYHPEQPTRNRPYPFSLVTLDRQW